MAVIRREIPDDFNLPRRIQGLGQLAYNLWWVWNLKSRRLFQDIDSNLWHKTNHKPVAFLQQVAPEKLKAAINNIYYLEIYDEVMKEFETHLNKKDTWFSQAYPDLINVEISYFSFEFGLHESLPVYAGGLGVLSGDHLKEASDLGLPLVGVGFVYKQGYFTQKVTEDGWQETRDYYLDFSEKPIIPLFDGDDPVVISVELPGRTVWARIWEVKVGRIPLYLLDTDVDRNTQNDRQLTAKLYSSDPEVRISQEILLGIGGVRALRKLGHAPCVWHMNEGHSAFLVLERARELVAEGKSFEEAAAEIKNSNIFTTHTPVPAGNDQFPVWLVERCFYQYWPELGLDRDQFIDLARTVADWGENFSMPVLALMMSEHRNGVSELHGHVSREMWKFLWPDRQVEDVPITHVTNGVHTGSWLARSLSILFTKYLGENWLDDVDDPELWTLFDNIPDQELWEVKKHLKRKLLGFITERARHQWLHGGAHPVQIIASGVLFDPQVLTIGFARRFSTYKRGNLILRDYERMIRIVTNVEAPVQFVFAGKAHPADEPGKRIIQEVYRAVKDASTGGRLIFLEDYDMNISRFILQGVDVWLNTPRRPQEASGTSGMKAALNGALNFSVLDGWWREGYNGSNGWPIGEDREYTDVGKQDATDAESLYATLENEIVPLYYGSRSADNLPNEWIAMMKESMKTTIPQFSMRRMVKEYVHKLYAPAIRKEECVEHLKP